MHNAKAQQLKSSHGSYLAQNSPHSRSREMERKIENATSGRYPGIMRYAGVRDGSDLAAKIINLLALFGFGTCWLVGHGGGREVAANRVMLLTAGSARDRWAN